MNTPTETSIPTDMSQVRTLSDWLRFDEARAAIDDVSAMTLATNRRALNRLSPAKRAAALRGSIDSWLRR